MGIKLYNQLPKYIVKKHGPCDFVQVHSTADSSFKIVLTKVTNSVGIFRTPIYVILHGYHSTLWKYCRVALNAEKNTFLTCTNHLPYITHTYDWPPISCSIIVVVDQVAFCRQRSYFPALRGMIKWTLYIQVLVNAVQSLSWTLICSVLVWKWLLKCSHFLLFRILINW